MAKKRLVTTERTLQYFNMTAFEGGDKGLFGQKLIAITTQITPAEREYPYQGTSINLEVISSEADNYIRGTVRQLRSIAPSVREMGRIETTPVRLKDNEGIDEKTHFIYCPETSLLCIEYNYHGPKIGLLVGVVNALYKEHIDKKERRSSYEYIQAHEAMRKVVQQKEVRSVTAKMIDPKTTADLSDALDLPSVFNEFKAPKHTVLEVSITSRTKGGAAMLISDFKAMFLRKTSDIELYEKLKVRVTDDETGKPVEYDLVHDKLQDTAAVQLTPGTSEINTPSMMKILEASITKVKKEYILT